MPPCYLGTSRTRLCTNIGERKDKGSDHNKGRGDLRKAPTAALEARFVKNKQAERKWVEDDA